MIHFWQKQSIIGCMLVFSLILSACTNIAIAPPPQSGASQVERPPQPATPTAEPIALAEKEPDTLATAFDPIVSTTFVEREGEGTLVDGAESTLIRMEHGLYMTFTTADLAPGEPMTIWWAIFNKPKNCSNDKCGIDDVFLVDKQGNRLKDEAGAVRPNLPSRAATEFSLLRATGTVIDVDGRAEFRAHLPLSDTQEVYFGSGLHNVMASEVHLIVRTHGPAIDGILHEQLNTDWGGCPEGWPKTPCGDLQLAIHRAPDQTLDQNIDAISTEMISEVQPIVSTTFVEWNGNGTVVEGAESTLVRMKHGLYTTVKTVGLGPGEAMTVWWAIFNKPENCSNDECGIDDAFLVDEQGNERLTEDGAPQLNHPGRAATEFSLLRATGTVIDTDGRAEFRAHLPLGDTQEVYFGPGLLNPMGAEAHVVVRTHGPSIPGRLHEQLNSDWGGCPEGWPKAPCGNLQVAIHLPPQ